jgi:hypothetical protein
MDRQLIWTYGDAQLVFSADLSGALYMDFNAFQPNFVSGEYDRKTIARVDGSYLSGAAIGNRRICFRATLLAYNIGFKTRPVETVIDEYKQLLCDAFNPRLVGRLTYRTTTGTYYVEATPDAVPTFEEIVGSTLAFAVELTADMPYWQSDILHRTDVGMTSPMANLPTALPFSPGSIVSVVGTATNKTHNDIYPIVRFNASARPVVLRNMRTGQTLQLNSGVSDGYYVEIDTADTKQTVTLWRETDSGEYEEIENVTHWLTVESDAAFVIVPGSNTLIVDNVTAASEPAVSVFWRDRWLGV